MMKYKTAKTNTPLKGVNLGGWLVLERWMTPSVFKNSDVVNEYEFSQTKAGRRAVAKHRREFVNESDIKWLAEVGIDVIRLPIGHWQIRDEPPYLPGNGEIDWLMKTAHKYKIKVLICLHAAPGAQNSNDHSGSGVPGRTAWYKYRNIKRTTDILCDIAKKYGQHPALWGIEILNEPAVNSIRQRFIMVNWVRLMVFRLGRILPKNIKIVFSDCYNPAWWHKKVRRAVLDVHHYQCFDLQDVCQPKYGYHKKLVKSACSNYKNYSEHRPVIFGEWSATLPPNVMSEENARDFCQRQLEILQLGEAWFFWSYKTEHNGSWNFRDCYEKGYFKGYL